MFCQMSFFTDLLKLSFKILNNSYLYILILPFNKALTVNSWGIILRKLCVFIPYFIQIPSQLTHLFLLFSSKVMSKRPNRIPAQPTWLTITFSPSLLR